MIHFNLDQINGAKKSEGLHEVTPMFSALSDKPFNDDDWIFEIKWDGYRAIAEIYDHQVSLHSRNLLSFNQTFSPIAETLSGLNYNAVFDGEIVVVDNKGVPSFQRLQQYIKEKSGNLVYYIFDLLFYNGYDLTNVPLLKRRKILEEILPRLPYIKVAGFIQGKGKEMFDAVLKNGLEGIMAKNIKSIYRPGIRTKEWLKIKTTLRQEVIIGGFTDPKGGRKYIGALIVGVYKNGELKYASHVGGGFNEKNLAELRGELDSLIIDKPPFKEKITTNTPATWVQPKLVAEVKFSEWTKDGRLRQPIFLGLRRDKNPLEVKREIAYIKAPLTNLNKVYFPRDGLTKKDVIDYYEKISPFILPYLKDRPQVLHRYPNGIYGERFYQKNMEKIPSWIETVDIYTESENKNVRYMLCQDLESLLYLVNLGCIEINPWNSRKGKLDYPDYAIIDIDPLDVGFKEVVKVALTVKEILQKGEIKGYCKTSGLTGLHIFIPLGGKYTTEQSKEFTRLIAYIVQKRMPDIVSVERLPQKRRRKIYLDYLQNNLGQTIASVYSLRPKDKAPVSTPLLWTELNENLKPEDFNIKTIFERLEKKGDIFSKVIEKGIDMENALQKLKKFISSF